MSRKKIASLLFPRYSFVLDVVNYNAKFHQWMKEHKNTPKVPGVRKFYEYLNNDYLKNVPVDFLEFGVYTGSSLNGWSEINTHPESRFFGFDTFEGLPEDWKFPGATLKKGSFSAGGVLPEVDPERAQLIPGLFQDTLEDFLASYTPKNQIVLHIDADLYTSALYVLTKMDALIGNDALVIFDEYSSALNEFKAFDDYLTSYRRNYKVVAATGEAFNQVAVRMCP